MKNIILVIVAAFLTYGAVHAQVRKCIGSDGKVTYSDFVCAANTASETSVRTNQNTVDHSAQRKDVRQALDATEAEKILSGPAPVECKFKSFKNGDAKGKVLADKAQFECVRNILNAKQGMPPVKIDYQNWNEHHTLEANKRKSTSTVVNCMPNGFGGLRCG